MESVTKGNCSATVFQNHWDEFCDVLIVGSGFAGLAAAFEAKSEGLNLLIAPVTKKTGILIKQSSRFCQHLAVQSGDSIWKIPFHPYSNIEVRHSAGKILTKGEFPIKRFA